MQGTRVAACALFLATAGLARALDLSAVTNATLDLPPDVTTDWLVTHLDAVAGIGGAIVAVGVAAIALLVLFCGGAAPSSGRPRRQGGG
ncbi:hypothetical protein Rsub_01694 [Raphidocelis subcapitata]|uniref:Uncharacterized protein n=1 Tax=Raphidocelis subcapitata TaxID=307507 RepID=A0A2V0NTC1_9CHLO|nr:hypothetical protein Rsub_01694 [Raphidocelis subcapitata]|eukprot:GBF88793.1 hypothetical protein Rsub_01694 [Raphidocelis subcapitata]